MRTVIISAISAAAVAVVFAVPALGSAAPAYRHHQAQVGVCVAYGTLPLIDADDKYAALVYTPPCNKGDTFVPAGPQQPGRR